MKRLLARTIATLWTCGTHAQGTFTFSNFDPVHGVAQPVFNCHSSTELEGPNMVAAIFLQGVQLGGTAPFRTGAGAGYWDAGTDSLRVVPGRFAGDVVSGFTVKVWDSSKGRTPDASREQGGNYGESKAFSITLGGPRIDRAQPPDSPGLMLNFQSFVTGTLACVPEPSVLMLAALGATVVLASHRRKQPVSTGRPMDSKL